jgi:hypothetical protein
MRAICPWIGPEIRDREFGLKSGTRYALLGALCTGLVLCSYAAEKITWKPVRDAILQIDGRAPKQWCVYSAGKKNDPLLLQLGARFLVIYVRDQAVYELSPTQLERKGDDLLWQEIDRPRKPTPATEWSTRDVGSAFRIRVKLAAEGRYVDIQIPHSPDLRGLY